MRNSKNKPDESPSLPNFGLPTEVLKESSERWVAAKDLRPGMLVFWDEWVKVQTIRRTTKDGTWYVYLGTTMSQKDIELTTTKRLKVRIK